MMDKKTYLKIEDYMLHCMQDSAHDAEHVYRVLYNAIDIAKHEENVDYDVLLAACLLHDIGRTQQFKDKKRNHAVVGGDMAIAFLNEIGFPPDKAEHVRQCILTHRFRSKSPPETLEAKILFDADKIDVSGAIGVARTLFYQGHVGTALYNVDGSGKVNDGRTDDNQSVADGEPSFFKEYHYKLKRIYDGCYTARANEIVEKRRKAMDDYCDNLLSEVRDNREPGIVWLEENLKQYQNISISKDARTTIMNLNEVGAFTKIEPIDKGWSNDKKYYAEKADCSRYLLRITDIEHYERKKTEFEMMKQVYKLGVPMQKPVDFGTFGEGQYVFTLLTWVDGTDAESVLPGLSEAAQYDYGVESGKMLKLIHSIQAPDTQEDWEVRFNRKTDWRVEQYTKYKEQGLTAANEEFFLNYAEENRYLLKNRLQSYQHGDYHPGNMIITPDGTLSIIDWNRDDFGDPWEEFNRITFTAHTSPYFATGQLHGYFDCHDTETEPPDDFFRLLALYISSNQLGVIGWATPFGKSEVDFAKKQNQEVLSWYDNMQTYIPSWYINKNSLEHNILLYKYGWLS